MHLSENFLVFDKKDCTRCSEGKIPSKIPCKKCGGSGDGVRGGKKKCRVCLGFGYNWDHNQPQTCSVCGGNYKEFELEEETDYLPKEIWENLRFKVYRHNRMLTLNESYLGFGCVYSCVDYGKSWDSKDEEIIEDVKKSTSH